MIGAVLSPARYVPVGDRGTEIKQAQERWRARQEKKKRAARWMSLDRRKATLVQLLFNELFGDDLELLP